MFTARSRAHLTARTRPLTLVFGGFDPPGARGNRLRLALARCTTDEAERTQALQTCHATTAQPTYSRANYRLAAAVPCLQASASAQSRRGAASRWTRRAGPARSGRSQG
eukprot:7390409-Prymnesium_polylepis.1